MKWFAESLKNLVVMTMQNHNIRKDDDPGRKEVLLRYRSVSWRAFSSSMAAVIIVLVGGGWALSSANHNDLQHELTRHAGGLHVNQVGQPEFGRHVADLNQRFTNIQQDLADIKAILTRHSIGAPFAEQHNP